MINNNFAEQKKAEAHFFDRIADIRTSNGELIAMEVDIRRATKHIPKQGEKGLLIDPKMTEILEGGLRDQYIKWVSHKPGARVLDLGCGAGWLALELARNGCHVDAYDLSPKAIALANKMLANNPYTEGFGSVTYHLQDVSVLDFGVETYDAFSGWSAFHHMPDVPEFMDKVYRALRPGGIVATMDDMPRGRLESGFEYFFEFILPTYNLTYPQKFKKVFNLITGKDELRAEIFSPMEEAKHSSVDEISAILYEKFEVKIDRRKNAFVGTPVMRIIGSDGFRYFAARVVIAIDRFLCKIGLLKGFERIMVAQKIK
ncbi:MAG: class I SAM-dependent methyltransferase [Bacteroidetes bacterium]|nr:class I SAM-dependent methyltransferase [Bacteroidota bacterium]